MFISYLLISSHLLSAFYFFRLSPISSPLFHLLILVRLYCWSLLFLPLLFHHFSLDYIYLFSSQLPVIIHCILYLSPIFSFIFSSPSFFTYSYIHILFSTSFILHFSPIPFLSSSLVFPLNPTSIISPLNIWSLPFRLVLMNTTILNPLRVKRNYQLRSIGENIQWHKLIVTLERFSCS